MSGPLRPAPSHPTHTQPPSALRRALADAGLVPAGACWRGLPGGRSGRVFRADAGRTVVCKLTRRHGASLLFRFDPNAEFAAHAVLAPLGLAPRPLARLRLGLADGIVYTHAEGTALTALVPGLATLLSKVHREAPDALVRRLPSRPALVPALIDRAIRHLAASGWPEAGLRTAADRALAEPAAPRRPVHGDPVPANVLDGGGRLLLIDWQCAHLGDPARDLAVALSPAMHLAYGSAPPDPAAIAAFRSAYGDDATLARLDRLAPAFHLQMIGHCLWRLDRGSPAYGAALAAEVEVLRTLL